MPETRNLKLSDVRSMLRLGGEIHSATDTQSRKQRLLLGLCRLVRARMGTCVVTHLDRRSRRRTVLSVVSTSVNGNGNGDHLHPAEPLSDEEQNPSQSGDTPVEHDHEALVDQAVPPIDDCALVNISSIGGTCIHSCVQVGQSGLAGTIRICCDRSRFTSRERALVNLFHLEMGWIYRADLPLAAPETSGISPRQRQTLELLLAGDSEKQIAAKLRLSQNTVHHYVKALYRHFHVSSRSELLSRWVGR